MNFYSIEQLAQHPFPLMGQLPPPIIFLPSPSSVFCRLFSKSIRLKYSSHTASFLKIRSASWLIVLFLLFIHSDSICLLHLCGLASSLVASSVSSLATTSRSNLSDYSLVNQSASVFSIRWASSSVIFLFTQKLCDLSLTL